MKKVLVPLAMRRFTPDSFAPLNAVRGTYVSKLVKYGLLPLFVAEPMTEEMREALYQESGGLLLLGGGDIDSRVYGEPLHPKVEYVTPELDQMEIWFIKKALQDRKPIFGICRGCQLLAVVSGGKLHQHLPDLNLNEKHEFENQDIHNYERMRSENLHEVIVEKESKAFRVLGKDRIQVSSGHHQAIRELGSDFVVSGRSPLGVVEIIEHKDPAYFCFGFESHPEVFEDGDLELFFSDFAAAVRATP